MAVRCGAVFRRHGGIEFRSRSVAGTELPGQAVERLDLNSDPNFNGRFRPEEEQWAQDAAISELLEVLTIRNIPQSRVLQVTG